MTPLSSSDIPRAEQPHMLEALAAAFTGARLPSSDDLDRLIRHLASCDDCRAGLALLLEAAAQRDDLTAEARSAFGRLLTEMTLRAADTHAVDAESLAVYAETLDDAGEAVARERFPFVASHLDQCEDCRATVEAARAVVAGAASALVAASGAITSPVEPAPATDEPSIWATVGTGALRLRERLNVLVGHMSVMVSGPLPGIEALASAPTSAPGLVSGAARDASIGLEERLIFTLRTPEPTDIWLRLAVELKAKLDRQLSVTITGQSLAAITDLPPDAEAVGAPWPGLAWRAEMLDGQVRRLVGQGATNANGQATFPMPSSGEYELTVSVGSRSWLIPFDVQHRP